MNFNTSHALYWTCEVFCFAQKEDKFRFPKKEEEKKTKYSCNFFKDLIK